MRTPFLLALLLMLSSTASSAQDRFNYRDEWRAKTSALRSQYVRGYIDGKISAVSEIIVQTHITIPNEVLREVIGDKSGFDLGVNTLAEVVTELYTDPANSFIAPSTMIGLAVHRLKGMPSSQLESFLSNARRAAEIAHTSSQRRNEDDVK